MTATITESPWHLLQISDVLDCEFATALAELVPVVAWKPLRTFKRIRPGEEEQHSSSEDALFSGHGKPSNVLRIRSLPLMPGFARFPISTIAPIGPAILKRLLSQTPDPERSPLICSVPYFASVAELWPGPVVYWLTDLIAAYGGANRAEVERLDRRLCGAANLVCPNSQRLEEYLIDRAGCDPEKIHIVPNATRAMNVLPRAPIGPLEKPAAIQHLARPIAGVIGNLAGNMDWVFLEDTIARARNFVPGLSWVFVGPTSMRIKDPVQRQARAKVMANPDAHFVGRQPYGELAAYARTFDVAVLPYLRCEPTYSGSSTRFYEHLAACRPMISTRGLEELVRKTPLLTLVDTPAQAVNALDNLSRQGFDDGLLDLRWRASLAGTWETRAQAVQSQLALRFPGLAAARAQELTGTENSHQESSTEDSVPQGHAQGSRPAAR